MEIPEGLRQLNEICGEGVSCHVAHEAVELMKEMAEALETIVDETVHIETDAATSAFWEAEHSAKALIKKFKEWK